MMENTEQGWKQENYQNLAETIINKRNTNGKFKNFNDFVERTQPTKAQIISLVKSGAIPTKNKKQFLIN